MLIAQTRWPPGASTLNISVVRASGVVALVGLTVAVGALIYLHVSERSISPLTQAVSRYGISPHRLGYRVMTITMGLAGASDGVVILNADLGRGCVLVAALLFVFAFCRVIISWFPMDATRTERTPAGRAHGLIALVTFVSASAAMLRFRTTLSESLMWSGWAGTSFALGAVTIAVFVGFIVVRSSATAKGFGLLERVLYLAILSWLTMLAVLAVQVQPLIIR